MVNEMVHVYLKNLRKSWLTGVLPPLIVIGFVASIAMGWPSLKDLILDRLAEMNNPIYQAILGDLGLEGLGLTWQAAVFMYAGGTMNILLLLVGLFPARSLASEIDKKTLDVILNYPIPRWRYLLEKFGVYMTYGLLFPVSIIGVVLGSTAFLGEEINVNLIINYSIGIYLLIFALGAISLLVVSIFLESNKSLTVAGGLVVGMYFLESLGGILESLGSIQSLSLFHYFKIGNILTEGMLPIFDVFIVLAIGIIALVSALVIFDKREFAI
jgi:ABC-2 type transport system permease protein